MTCTYGNIKKTKTNILFFICKIYIVIKKSVISSSLNALYNYLNQRKIRKNWNYPIYQDLFEINYIMVIKSCFHNFYAHTLQLI